MPRCSTHFLDRQNDSSEDGYEVTIFEALHKPGGVLIYGIPEFRLPKAIVRDEIRSLEAMGVEFRCNFVVGTTATIEGSEYVIELDSVIVGIGQGANPLLTRATDGLEVDKRGRIVTEEITQMTSIPGVFAGGDIVTGAATVILAMGAGKLAARSIDCYLRGVDMEPPVS